VIGEAARHTYEPASAKNFNFYRNPETSRAFLRKAGNFRIIGAKPDYRILFDLAGQKGGKFLDKSPKFSG
jgi:hypothetical protein